MNRTGTKLAFQLNPEQSIKHALGENDVLASRKANIQMKDGSTRRVTLFFRAQPDELVKLQNQGLADSSQVTAERLRKLLLKQGINFVKIEQLFHQIRVHNHASEKAESQIRQSIKGRPSPLERQKSFSQLAAGKLEDGWARTFATPDIPVSLVGSAFIKAIEDGKMLRIDSQMHESEPKPKNATASATSGTTTTTLTTTTPTTTSSVPAANTTAVTLPPADMPALPTVPTSPSIGPMTLRTPIHMIDNS